MIKQSLDSDLKQAMLSGDKELATTLRTLKSVILDSEVNTGKRDEGLSDDEIIVLFSKEMKKRQESSKIYLGAGDQNRSDKELSEVEVIKKYLPEMMSEDEIKKIAKEIVDASGPVSMQQMGQIIGQVKSKAGATADGSLIASIVKELLSK